MNEMLEVDYEGEDFQHEPRVPPKHEEEIENVPSPNEKLEANHLDIKQDKIESRANDIKKSKDPVFFVLRLSEEILSTSLSSRQLIVAEEVFNCYKIYFETYLNVYIILLANESNIIRAFTKKLDQENLREGVAVWVPFDLRYEVDLPLNEVLKETTKLTDKDIKFDEILTKIKVFVGEKLRDIISRRSKKKAKTVQNQISDEKKEEKKTEEYSNNDKGPVDQSSERIKNVSSINENAATTTHGNKRKNDKKDNNKSSTKRNKRSRSRSKNERRTHRSSRKRSHHSKSSSSSSSKKKAPTTTQAKFPPYVNPQQRQYMSRMMGMPAQHYFYDYMHPDRTIPYYYHQAMFSHNPVNPMYQPKHPIPFMGWMQQDMKEQMMNPEYMKTYYDQKYQFGEIRPATDDMVQPINISNINYIKNPQKTEDYSRKKRRRKSESSSSSSSGSSSEESRKKRYSHRRSEKKEEKPKPKTEKKPENNSKRERKSKFSNEIDKKIEEPVKTNENPIIPTGEIEPKVELEKTQKDEGIDSGENTDELMKNSPLINPKARIEIKKTRERKTKFSSELPKKEKENMKSSPIDDQKVKDNPKNDVIMPNSRPTEEDEVKEKITINITKRPPIKINAVQPSEHQLVVTPQIKKESFKEDDKEEGEIEERVSKNFKIVNSEGRKKIVLTNKRQVTEIKVIKRDNN